MHNGGLLMGYDISRFLIFATPCTLGVFRAQCHTHDGCGGAGDGRDIHDGCGGNGDGGELVGRGWLGLRRSRWPWRGTGSRYVAVNG